jgi:hypothetical protein
MIANQRSRWLRNRLNATEEKIITHEARLEREKALVDMLIEEKAALEHMVAQAEKEEAEEAERVAAVMARMEARRKENSQ